MRVGRPRPQLGVRLRRDIERVHVARQLDVFDERAVGARAREHEASRRDLLAVGVVHLVAVAVALVRDGRIVELFDDRARRERGLVQPQAHRAAEVSAGDDVDLLGHRRDDRKLGLGVEFGAGCSRQVGDRPRVLDHHALQPEAQPEHGDAVLAREAQGAQLALDAAHAEASRHANAVEIGEVLRRALGRLALVTGDPADADFGLVREAARAQRLGHAQVGVGQVDVLAHEADRDLALGLVHGREQVFPAIPLHLVGAQIELVDDVRVEALAVQHRGDVVDRENIHRIDDGGLVDVAHERDLAAVGARDGPVAAQYERVGLDADRAQHRDGVLRRLGLLLATCPHERHERHVHEEHVAAAQLVAHLPGRLDERLRLDVADGAADLGDDDVGLRLIVRLQAHAPLDLVGDVRNHLHRVAEVLAPTLARDHGRVDLAGRDVRGLAQVDVEKALVVADVEVGLGAVVGHEDLTMLERVHRARVDVEVRVKLLHDDTKPARGEQIAQARGRQTLAERRDHATRDEDVLGDAAGAAVIVMTTAPVRKVAPVRTCLRRVHHGVQEYLTTARLLLDALIARAYADGHADTACSCRRPRGLLCRRGRLSRVCVRMLGPHRPARLRRSL